jgi:serine protease Do
MTNPRMSKLLIILFAGLMLVANAGFSACRNAAPPAASAADQAPPQAAPAKPDQTLIKQLSGAFEYAAGRVSPSIVPIYATSVVSVPNPYGMPDNEFRQFFGDDFFRHFFGAPQGPSQQTVHSLGSGVIVSEDGYILTNNHVVAKAKKLSVVMGNRKNQKIYSARLVGADPATDLAVIKIEAKGLPKADLGDSDAVEVGQWVIAVGNPFQLMHTVTAGIISAKGRSSVEQAAYEDFFQTDASINPGNSGGALADLDGRVIGINTAIETPSGGNVGIGFAIPVNMAKKIMPQLIAKGKVLRGYLDVILQDITDELAKAMKLKSTQGVLVSSVGQGGPADKAGLKQGDVITALNGKPVVDMNELRDEVAGLAPGSTAKLTVLRNDKELTLTAVVGERPANLGTEPRPEQQPKPLSSERLGLSVQTLTPGLASQLGFRGEKGVVITDVANGSPADDAGLQRGDLIKEVNRIRIQSAAEFEDVLRKLKAGETVALLVQRGASNFYVAITVQ